MNPADGVHVFVTEVPGTRRVPRSRFLGTTRQKNSQDIAKDFSAAGVDLRADIFR
jgi:hypothetical protein